MVANLLTHSNLLRELPVVAPITERLPLGFQSEQRNYWEVPEFTIPCSIYECEQNENSAYWCIEADNNPGTFTLQSAISKH
jgi:hypothetical protein